MLRAPGEIQNICLISTHGYFDPVPQLGRTDTGGQVVYVLELAKALSLRGIHVDIFTRWFDQAKPPIDPLPDCPNVRVIRIPAGPWEFIVKEEIYGVLPELAQNLAAFIHQGDLRYDLFHGHYVDAGIVTLDVANEFGVPAFFTAHSLGAWKRADLGGDDEEMEAQFNFEHRVAEELRIFQSVRAQTVTTQLQEDKIKELYGFTSQNIVNIPPGVDVHTYRPLGPNEEPRTMDWPSDYIFCLSRIDSNKGLDLLLKAFARMAGSTPEVHLVIGGGSPQPQQRERDILVSMDEIISEKGIAERVHILGYVPDELVAPLYQQSRMFVVPSIFEPFGMTALEAMACAKPVVASKFGGIQNVITSGQNGLLVDPTDEKEFADAMTTLSNQSALATTLGAAAYETIQQSFSWEAIADRHIAFYQHYMHE